MNKNIVKKELVSKIMFIACIVLCVILLPLLIINITIITIGDANNTEDSLINISQIKGEVVTKINGLGLVIKFFKSLYGKLLILLIAILLI